jgi:hypothetical protein
MYTKDKRDVVIKHGNESRVRLYSFKAECVKKFEFLGEIERKKLQKWVGVQGEGVGSYALTEEKD